MKPPACLMALERTRDLRCRYLRIKLVANIRAKARLRRRTIVIRPGGGVGDQSAKGVEAERDVRVGDRDALDIEDDAELSDRNSIKADTIL